MKFTIFALVTLFPLYSLTELFTPPAQAQRVVDPVPPSVIEIPPLSEAALSPDAILSKILESGLDTDLPFREQASSTLAPEFLERLNQILETPQTPEDTVARIRSSLDPERTPFESPQEIPVPSILGEN